MTGHHLIILSVKMQHLKMTEQTAGHENAGRDNAGHAISSLRITLLLSV